FVFPRIGEFVRCGVITRRSVANHKITDDSSAASSPDVSESVEAENKDDGTGSQKEKDPEVATYDKVIGTVVLERAWDVITLFILAAAILILRWGKFGDFVVEKMWKPASENLNFSLWWIIGGVIALLVVAVLLIVKFRDRSRACAAVCRVCRGILDGFTSAFRMKAKWKFFLNTLLIWAMYWLMAVFTMHAIPSLAHLTAVDALFLAIAGSFGWLIPVPGGFGSYHFIVAIALQYIYGLPFSLGIVFATLSHESQAVTMMLTGLFSYLYETFRK
ncbi:MAG: flippase-like domain-containing protein, partial [Bacteroidales bacterium]|nr:flippase-like domain-containing protein [Bacteroidales bacterium]